VVLVGDFEGETVGVEAFALVDFGFAIDAEADFVLAVIDLPEGMPTLEYSLPISSLRIFLSTASFCL
jgi:hypothetical protein